ncbi:EAL domain-containing protein [Curvivirga sp.]|uniref:EAL domain-containing protein n=1 Tax=Curvivirga sp. TaxID=2856848 RepID=UPI003B591588
MEDYNEFDEELQIYTPSALLRRASLVFEEAKKNKTLVGLIGVNFSETIRIRSLLGAFASMQARKEIVSRSKSKLPDNHLIGRGTDSLIICLPGMGREATKHLADEIALELNIPITYEGFTFDLAPKVTVCEYPGTVGYVDVREVTRIWGSFIDIAQTREAQVNMMSENDLFHINEKQRIDRNLLKAIPNGEFKLVYQPRVHMQTGKVVGCEALLRWESPELGHVSPAVFIPRAEATGIIHSITPWVIERAGLSNKFLQQQFGDGFRTGINLSPANVNSPNLIQTVKKALDRSETTAQNLDFEITESLLLENKSMVMNQLNSMRQQGAHTALDDFGTGFSSLSLLARIPLDVLKIDQSFIQKLDQAESQMDLNVIKAIRDLGNACGLQIVAEGMETREQVDILINRVDVEYGQGYFFGRPMSASEFIETYA